MPENKDKNRERVAFLADRLALALVYIEAMDSAIDPFEADDAQQAWLLATLTGQAKAAIFRDTGAYAPLGVDSTEVIQACGRQAGADVRQLEAYAKYLGAVRDMLKNG